MTESKTIHYIDFDLMKKMCHPIAVALFDTTKDPMSKFDDHERSLLESALNNPRQTFHGKELYPSFEEKAAILYYGLLKNHAFKNGNKRTATAAMLVFLMINNLQLEGDEQQIEDYLVELAKRVASSKGTAEKDMFLKEIAEWLRAHIVPEAEQESILQKIIKMSPWKF